MPVWTIVVAAGSGSRFGAAKQYQRLGADRVLDWSLRAARAASEGVVLVVPPEMTDTPEPAADRVVAGGRTRSESVRAGLAVVPEYVDVIVVHDGARPLAGAAVWDRVLRAVADGADGAVPCVPVADTLREVDGTTTPRERFVAVQTPQAFRAASLRAAHHDAADASDDASLVEAAGGRVVVVDGEASNLKITTPVDLVVAEALCRT